MLIYNVLWDFMRRKITVHLWYSRATCTWFSRVAYRRILYASVYGFSAELSPFPHTVLSNCAQGWV